MITTTHLTYTAGRRSILRGINASFETGRISAILGPNGAGKSTLLGCLAGALTPARGSITIDGRALEAYSLGELARKRAVLSQVTRVPFPFTALEIVIMGRNPYTTAASGPEDAAVAEEAMRLMDVWSLRDRLFPSLSGGEQQRVHLARVLTQVWAQRDAYLLLDEPTSALDLKHQYQTLDLIRTLRAKQNLGVVIVMHDLALARSFTDRTVFIKSGHVAHEGPSGDVINCRNLSEIYEISKEYAERYFGA
ncbi:MAG: heme ABC transporter ATP-binding protein [Alphaproteobacteria bacterium]|nr:heme ABC transporter ATP-binding protein [Alphaproteobacteria bacterium]